jgi:hypothetical protein
MKNRNTASAEPKEEKEKLIKSLKKISLEKKKTNLLISVC